MSAAQTPDGDTLNHWLLVYLAIIIGEPADSLDAADPLSEYDLDSIDAVTMALELEKTFNFRVPPETFMDQTASVDEIVSRLLQAT